MAISTVNVISGPYTGNDVTATFSYTFTIEDSSQLAVYEFDAAGTPTLLTLDVDYTVAGVGTVGGGTVTRTAGALPSGSTWYIRANYNSTQATSFVGQGAFFPAIHEGAVDKVTYLVQQLEERLGRTIKLADSDFTTGGLELPTATDRAGLYMRFNASTGALELFDLDAVDAGLQSQITALLNLYNSAVAASVAGSPATSIIAPSINALLSIDETTILPSTSILVNDYHADVEGGGGVFIWDATGDKANHNGGTIIDPNITFPTDWTNQTQLTTWFTASTGTGVWRRQYDGAVDVKWFGAKGDGVTDDTAAIQAAIDVSDLVVLQAGSYSITSITVDSNTTLRGLDRHKSILKVANSASDTITANTQSKVIIENLTIDYSSATSLAGIVLQFQSSTDVILKSVTVIGTTSTAVGHVMQADSVIRLNVEDCQFFNVLGGVTRAANCQYSRFTGNHYENVVQNVSLQRCIIIGNGIHSIIEGNIFKDVGVADYLSVNGQCCIDIGDTDNIVVANNNADNVHSFIDIEASSTNEMKVSVTGNILQGLKQAEPTALGKGLWVNNVALVTSISMVGNSVSYFNAGAILTASESVLATGNTFSNCDTAIALGTGRKFSVTGNTIEYCTNGITNAVPNTGFSGGIIADNNFEGITTDALSLDFGAGAPVNTDRYIVSNNMIYSGTILYTDIRVVEEYGNVHPAEVISDGDTTPTLTGNIRFLTSNTGATNITAFDVPFGESKLIYVNDANTSVVFNNASGGIYGNSNTNATVSVLQGRLVKVSRLDNAGSTMVEIIA